LVAYGLLNPHTHFVLLYPQNGSNLGIQRTAQELSFFIEPERISIVSVANPHAVYSQLIDDAMRYRTPFYRAGYATQQIGIEFDRQNFTQDKFETKLAPLLESFSEELSDFLYTQLKIDNRLVPKIFLWGRNSGRKNGTHVESDSTGPFLKLLHDTVTTSPVFQGNYQIIFIGDKHRTRYDLEALQEPLRSEKSVNMFEFWKTEAFARLQQKTHIPSPILQLLLFYKLDQDGHTSLHFSNRSGIIDKLAFSLSLQRNHFVEFVPKDFTNSRLNPIAGKYIHLTELEEPVSQRGLLLQDCSDRVKYLQKTYHPSLGQLDTILRKPFDPEKLVRAFSTIPRNVQLGLLQKNQ